MPFTKFVEVGRIAYIAFGRDIGKICAIVDVIDQNRALIDGPVTKVERQSCSFKRLHLTKFRIKIQHSCSTKLVRKAWTDENISEKWAETGWAKRLQDKRRKARLTDFDRFKLMKAKQSRNKTIKREFNKLKRKNKKLLGEKPKPKVSKPTKEKPAVAQTKPKKAEGKTAPKKESKKAEKPAKK